MEDHRGGWVCSFHVCVCVCVCVSHHKLSLNQSWPVHRSSSQICVCAWACICVHMFIIVNPVISLPSALSQ